MKTMLIAGAALSALLYAAPSFAQATGPQGYVGVAVQKSEAELAGFEAEGEGFAIDGAVAFSAGEGLGFQFDGVYSDADDVDGSYNATAHLYSQSETLKFGGFVGLADSTGDDDDGDPIWAAGAELQAFHEGGSFLASLGYATTDSEGVDVDLLSLQGGARFFMGDNFRFDAGGGISRLTADDEDGEAFNVSVGGEYKPDALPFSVFVSYSHFEAGDLDFRNDTLTIGARFNFGGGTLRDRDRNGPSFQPLGGIANGFAGL